MPDNTSPYQLHCAQLTWQPNDIPFALPFSDTYYTVQNGLAETQYVFLTHNQLTKRWQALHQHQHPLFTIGETGFGTGLNFLASWQLWRTIAPANARLHFISVEKYPLHTKDLQRALAIWPTLKPLSKQLLDHYPTLVPGHHCLKFDDDKITLHLWLGDANECLAQWSASTRIDAWFLDGFAPAQNPSMWDMALLQQIAKYSHTGTSFATFTAAGNVRRNLIKQGFTVKKKPGYGHKRDMLCGHYTGTAQLPTHHQPVNPTKRITIIGGGLAGVLSAHALARRGYRVTILERQAKLAQGASGNPQAVLYTRLSADTNHFLQFTLHSYLYALRFYHNLAKQGGLANNSHDFCGVLQLADSDQRRRLWPKLRQAFAHHDRLVQFANAEQASALAGMAIPYSGWYFPTSGWLSPHAVCAQLSKHHAITVKPLSEVIELNYQQQCWHIIGTQQQLMDQADIVIIANSIDALRLTPTLHLPLKPVRGQITMLPTNPYMAALRTVICYQGHMLPAIDRQHHIGATFIRDAHDTAPHMADHQHNLHTLLATLPGSFPEVMQAGFDVSSLSGWVGLRCTTPDRLPLAGPLTKDSHYTRHPNLYVNVGHGSRGLATIPLCSEIIATIINREPSPVSKLFQQALDPARF